MTMHKVGGRHIDLVVMDQPSRTMKKGNCRHRGVKRKQKEVLYCGAWDIRSTRETQLTIQILYYSNLGLRERIIGENS